jgi:hypothetical protein
MNHIGRAQQAEHKCLKRTPKKHDFAGQDVFVPFMAMRGQEPHRANWSAHLPAPAI